MLSACSDQIRIAGEAGVELDAEAVQEHRDLSVLADSVDQVHALVLGENPWKSEKRLFTEKTTAPRIHSGGGGSSSGGQSAMARGTALEPYARGRYQ